MVKDRRARIAAAVVDIVQVRRGATDRAGIDSEGSSSLILLQQLDYILTSPHVREVSVRLDGCQQEIGSPGGSRTPTPKRLFLRQVCLPVPPLGHIWCMERDSNSHCPRAIGFTDRRGEPYPTFHANWKRRWDLNPRCLVLAGHFGFRDRRHKPDSPTPPLAESIGFEPMERCRSPR